MNKLKPPDRIALRKFWMPRLRPMDQQCASCPFKDGNDKEFGAIHRRLAKSAGVPIHPVSVLTSRMRVRADIATAFVNEEAT